MVSSAGLVSSILSEESSGEASFRPPADGFSSCSVVMRDTRRDDAGLGDDWLSRPRPDTAFKLR